MKCCICGEEIAPVGDWTMGNNAEPVADGRCCNDCDNRVVIPTRLAMFVRGVTSMKEDE